MKNKKRAIRLCSLMLLLLLICSVTSPALAIFQPPAATLPDGDGPTVYDSSAVELPKQVKGIGKRYYNHVHGTVTYINVPQSNAPYWEPSDDYYFTWIEAHPNFEWHIEYFDLVERETVEIKDKQIGSSFSSGCYEVVAYCDAYSVAYWEYAEIQHINELWHYSVSLVPVGGSSEQKIIPPS